MGLLLNILEAYGLHLLDFNSYQAFTRLVVNLICTYLPPQRENGEYPSHSSPNPHFSLSSSFVPKFHELQSSKKGESASFNQDPWEIYIIRKEEKETQMKNIFHFRCLVMGKLCASVIDGGSSANMASLKLVEKLREFVVYKQVALAFNLESYKDKIVCDVVPMEATYILLGRPWQSDSRVAHDGVTNRFYI
ncbi:hypothetical protein CR513_11118, partial [Mucuna pruriens]